MRIYKTVDTVDIHQHPNTKKLYVNGTNAGSLIFNENMKYEIYSESEHLEEFYVLSGILYRKFEHLTENKGSTFVDERNKKLNIPEFFINNIYTDEKLAIKNYGVCVRYVRNYPKKRDRRLVILDFNNQTVIDNNLDSIFYKQIDDSIYEFNDDNNEVVKRDLLLNNLWSFKPKFQATKASGFIKWQDKFFVFLGPKEESMFTENSKPRLTFSGGSVFGFNDIDGTVIWELDIPEAIDDMRLHNDMLYIAIYAQLRVINPLNGEIIKVIETGTSLPDYRQFSAHVFVDDNYIFYTHAEDEVLIIYDVNTYELVHKVSLPVDHQPQWHQFTDENTGKHYFTVNNNSQFVARSPVLEVDPANLLSHVEFEVEPEKTVEFISVNGDASQQELVITMTSESLDDALRFGEIHTRDLTQHHSFNHYGMSFAGRKPTETFNGTVRFVLSGCNADKNLITERLAIMEKRFDIWVEDEGFYACTDNSVLTHLVTEYKA